MVALLSQQALVDLLRFRAGADEMRAALRVKRHLKLRMQLLSISAR
jgi:hypothetical protein